MAQERAPSSVAERRCPNCGTRVARNAESCFMCGYDLRKQPQRGRRISWVDVVLVVLTIALVIALQAPGLANANPGLFVGIVGAALMVAPIALAVEGTPPPLDGRAIGGFVYLTLIATALAYAAWFHGLQQLSAGTVGLIGLLTGWPELNEFKHTSIPN